MADDYYKTLGVRRDASQADILKAYRDLARKYHPDLNPDDAAAKTKFQKVQAAFDVLNDAEKREMYDRYGSSFDTMGAGGPRAGPFRQAGPSPGFGGFGGENVDFSQFFGEHFNEESPGGFSDIFSHFRQREPRGSRQRATRQRNRGGDIRHEVQIPFTTSVTGGEAQIAVRHQSGKMETISVKIPAGIWSGKKIRLRGQGEPAVAGGQPGDLLLTVRVSPHAHFHRRGNHLYVRVPVTLAEAALGAKVDVPTPRGTVSLRVPPNTSSGAKLRIKGRGVENPGEAPGDLLAEIEIVLPENLDEASQELIRKLDEQQPQNPRAKLQW